MSENLSIFDKIWNAHVVEDRGDGTCLLYIDRHLMHEVTSPQAFETLKENGYNVRHVNKVLAVADHITPTKGDNIKDEQARLQLNKLEENAAKNGIRLYSFKHENNGICHVVAPEQGFSLPGVTLVCGDSHTATHGAVGAIAFGIGTSEVGHVLATNTIIQKKPKTMRIKVNGKLGKGVSAKDLALYLISKMGTKGGTGFAVEYAGEAIENLSMEGRLTLCNMAIEGGARFGIVAPDETTFDYLKDRPLAPRGEMWDKAVAHFKTLKTDEGAKFDKEVEFDASDIAPFVTFGTSPEDAVPVTGEVPMLESFRDEAKKEAVKRSLKYMGLDEGTSITDIKIDVAFIGSCTNGRLEDLISAANVIKGRKIAEGVKAIVVPGSEVVKQIAEAKGIDKIFKDAGFEWRNPGCSMCLAMNDDRLTPFERCASTSNRNFEGRQGRDGRTHLVSPAMAAAAAIAGHFVDVREF
jgi:3-isopropylmalate/(R)-2-methylmalate dehydratase large subunit